MVYKKQNTLSFYAINKTNSKTDLLIDNNSCFFDCLSVFQIPD